MSDLYARIPTSARKTVPTARGFKSTGIEAEVCSWEGKVVSNIWWNDDDGKFWFNVRMAAHHGTEILGWKKKITILMKIE